MVCDHASRFQKQAHEAWQGDRNYDLWLDIFNIHGNVAAIWIQQLHVHKVSGDLVFILI
jgi:hypothetical protein